MFNKVLKVLKSVKKGSEKKGEEVKKTDKMRTGSEEPLFWAAWE